MALMFAPLVNKSVIKVKLINHALGNDPWFPYYNFEAKPVPYDLVLEDPFFQWLHPRYKFLAGIIKLPPYTCYDWHVDTRRGVGINMLLQPEGSNLSRCMFAKEVQDASTKFMQLHYRPDTYYVFNTQKEHMVINFQKPRYMFSVEFLKGKDELSWNDLYKDIKENYEKNITK